MAVGVQNPQSVSGGDLNLVEEWNGTSWTLETTPNSSVFGDGLEGVDCFLPTSCVAGGWQYTDNTSGPYDNAAIAWNGSSWVLQSVPNATGTNSNEINSMSCVVNSLCLAVGFQGTTTTPWSTEALTAPVYRTGYTEVAADGGIFNFGSNFYGSMGGQPLNKPVVGLALTPDGGGYWEVAADGGIFSFGNATFYGSMGAKLLNAPVVAIAATPDGGGYWEVAADGGIFAFGDAPFRGSLGGQPLNKPIVGLPPRLTAAVTGKWPQMAPSSFSAMPSPMVRPAPSRRTTPSWALRPPRMERVTTRWPLTEGSSPSAMRSPMDRWADNPSTSP